MNTSQVYDFLSLNKLGVLSSIAANGSPQSALVGIAITPALEIIFDTVKASRKYRNLRLCSRCSFVIGWQGEQTVQFEGLADELVSEPLTDYHRTYFAAWPECRAHLSWPDIAYFVVRPLWIRYSDYDQGPPLIQEFNF